MVHFAEPAYLWLLLLIPLVWWMSRRLRLVSPVRRYTIVGLRTLLLLAVILALAQLELRRTSRDLAVFFLLDRSASVPPAQQAEQIDLVDTLSRNARDDDQTGVIVFGDRPSMETSPVRGFDFERRLFSSVGGQGTDIAAGLRLALAAFPPAHMRRIVLLSDGNENRGSALEVARIARNSGIPVDVVPMRYESRNDVQVEKVVVPQRVAKDAPFELKVYLEAEEETTGRLRIFEDGDLIIEDDVTVRAGRNPPLVIPRRLTDGGFHNYTATFEAAGDTRPQNNRANAFTFLRAEPRVLLIEGSSQESARYLVGALQAENIVVEIGGPESIPLSFEGIQRYDTVILSNVPASAMSIAQMRMIERGVHDLGIGLVMIGGEDSFGAGGYIDTPIELALPVEMDIKQKKLLPNGALVTVLHTCEMPSGNDWAREVCLVSLNVLASQDYFGVIYYGQAPGGGNVWGDVWLWQPALQQVGDKIAMRTAVKGVQPLDAQAFDGLLSRAADELIRVQAQTKHIVVISDGDPSPPTPSTVKTIRDAGITVSGVAIYPHDPSTVQTLRDMAYWGGGEFYYPQTGTELPRIFTKEATVVRKSLIRERPFTPRFGSPSEVLLGFTGFPDLDGYVLTTRKDLATEALSTPFEDPLLVHWRYGLGKSVAFTSDAKDKWASNWVAWGSFSKFWSQTIRWSLRETNNPNYQVNTEVSGGTGRVTIDAVDDDGNFRNFLDFDAKVIGPDFEPQDLSIRQVAPGRYEATFPASEEGTYMLSMTTGDGEDGEPAEFLTSGLAVSYSPEYETSRSNETFLESIADASGGVVVQPGQDYDPYLRNLTPTRRPVPLWPWLLVAAALLLPADVFFRRVYVNWADVGNWIVANVFGFLPGRRSAPGDREAMASLQAAKRRAHKVREEEQQEREARAAFRDRVARQQAEQKGQPSVFSEQEQSRPVARKPEKQTYSAEDKPPAEGGLSALMEAKKRAQQRRRK